MSAETQTPLRVFSPLSRPSTWIWVGEGKREDEGQAWEGKKRGREKKGEDGRGEREREGE